MHYQKQAVAAIVLIAILIAVYLIFFKQDATSQGERTGSQFFENIDMLSLFKDKTKKKPNKSFKLDTEIFSDRKYSELRHEFPLEGGEAKPGKSNPFQE